MIAHDAVVASLLTRSGESRGTVEGLPLEITAPLTGYDLLRIEDGRVIERWTSQAFPASPRVEAVASLDPLAPAISPRTPVLERLTIEQFAAYEVESHGGTIVLVESGNVSVHVAASQAATFGASSPSTLAAGQSLAIPAHTPFRLANSDLASVSILALTIPPFDPDDSRNHDPAYSARPDTPPPGVSRTLLMNGMTIVPGDHPSIVTMIRMAMPAGIAVANHIAESAMLLVIEGAIEATIQAGTAALMTSQESALNQSGTLILPAGEGIAAPAGAELTWRTAVLDPATAVLVTISPIDERD
jgi:mannose-6-phosphate isomerase-like protein (cupin superfamily)